MDGWRVQSVDLTGRTAELLGLARWAPCSSAAPWRRRPTAWIRDGGGLVFPAIPSLPFDAYRGTLYDAEELYAGLEHGYDATPDAQIYAWSRQHDEKGDTSRTLAAALHDHAIADALARAPRRQAVDRRDGRTRDRSRQYDVPLGRPARSHARPGRPHRRHRRRSGRDGGGEPGCFAVRVRRLRVSTGALARWPPYRRFSPSVAAWAAAGLAVRREFPGDGGVSIPTWFYGHEPPNVFASSIAKYFSNAQREDVLLSRARGGILYLPGAAGTVQEIFQAVTPNYYGDPATQIPLILVGVDHWTVELPVWPLLTVPGRRPPYGPLHPPGRHHRGSRQLVGP